jgi:3-oxoacyl-ACP reductase-like protein
VAERRVPATEITSTCRRRGGPAADLRGLREAQQDEVNDRIAAALYGVAARGTLATAAAEDNQADAEHADQRRTGDPDD